MQRCIKACSNCIKKMPINHPCVLCCSDCLNICKFSSEVNLNNTFLEMSLLDLCINACNFCILECSKHIEHHTVCKECVEACSECIIECNEQKMEILEDKFE